MTYCTCWKEYPNESHKKSNGKWLCVDKYRCVRPLEYKKVGTIDMPYRKTKCERIEVEGSDEELEYEIWDGYHGQTIQPKGTFDKIWEDAKKNGGEI